MALKYNNSSVRAISFVGSNLQPIKDWSERTINGVTCSIRDGVGYLNGTSTAGSWQRTEIGTITLPAGTYTIYFWTNFVETAGPQLLRFIGLGLWSSGKDYYQCNTNKYRTFTLDAEETFSIAFWWQTDGMVFDNIWIKSMVREGAYDPTTQYVAYDPTPKVINKLIYNNTVAWCRPIRFEATKTLDDNIMSATFPSGYGLTITKVTKDGYFKISGSATTTIWNIKQLKFTETGTYYVKNFNWASSNIVRCYLSSFSDSSYPNDYWLKGSTLTFNITQANTTCNIVLYVAANNVGKTINQVLKIYVGKTNATSFDQLVTATTDDYTASIISTEEPSITSVPKYIVNGNDTYYGSRVRFVYYVGIDRAVKTVSVPSSTTLTLNSSSITSVFQGNYGFQVYNANSITCTGYWYANYFDPRNPGPTKRVPSSGYNTFSVNANSTSSRQYVIGPTMTSVYVYVYLSGTRTTTTTTTYNNYDGTPDHLSDTSYNDARIEDQLYSRTFVGTSDKSLPFISLSLDHWVKTSETSSSTTITSSTVGKSLTTS